VAKCIIGKTEPIDKLCIWGQKS